MKRLLIKEFRLPASPVSYFFVLFAGMTMIPNYPILVGAVMVCLGIFYSFQSAREANDIFYTVLLPVRKGDTVRAKYAFSVCLEMAAFLIMAALAVLRMTVLRDVPVYANSVMMPADPLFLAFALLIFTTFNRIFIGGFFRTAYAIGRPFVTFIIVGFLLVGVAEAIYHLPVLALLQEWPLGFALKCALLGLSVVYYILGTRNSMRQSIQHFVALDL